MPGLLWPCPHWSRKSHFPSLCSFTRNRKAILNMPYMNDIATSHEITICQHNAVDTLTTLQLEAIVKFLHTHLGQYGDRPEHIRQCVEYAVSPRPYLGGFVLQAMMGDKVVGILVMNRTNMGGFIPENVLVYIATDSAYRGQGIGKRLMEEAIATAKGDIALHVEKDNPAKGLYEKMGFTNPYLEMRLKHS